MQWNNIVLVEYSWMVLSINLEVRLKVLGLGIQLLKVVLSVDRLQGLVFTKQLSPCACLSQVKWVNVVCGWHGKICVKILTNGLIISPWNPCSQTAVEDNRWYGWMPHSLGVFVRNASASSWLFWFCDLSIIIRYCLVPNEIRACSCNISSCKIWTELDYNPVAWCTSLFLMCFRAGGKSYESRLLSFASVICDDWARTLSLEIVVKWLNSFNYQKLIGG